MCHQCCGSAWPVRPRRPTTAAKGRHRYLDAAADVVAGYILYLKQTRPQADTARRRPQPMNTTRAPEVRQPVSTCPPPPLTPLSGLSDGLLALIIPAVVVAIVSGYIALSRMRDQSAPKGGRNVTVWGLNLGFITLVVIVLFLLREVAFWVSGGD
jgi:hypothetical protein